VQISWHFIFEGGEASRYPWDWTGIVTVSSTKNNVAKNIAIEK
jgi:hypothetical protein